MDETMYLDVKQFAARSGLPVATIEKLLTAKKLPAVIIGKRRLIPAEALKTLGSLLPTWDRPVNKGMAPAIAAEEAGDLQDQQLATPGV